MDIYTESRQGKDAEALVGMMRDLRLGSCAEAAWSQTHRTFQTHGARGGDSKRIATRTSTTCL